MKRILVLTLSVIILAGCAPKARPISAFQHRPVTNDDLQTPGGSAGQGIRSDYKSGEVKALCDQAMAKAQKSFDAIAAEAKQAPEARTFATTTLALEKVFADLSDETTPLTFMGYVSTDSTVRDEGSDCESRVGQFNVSVLTRQDLYNAIRDMKGQNADEARLQDQIVLAFEKSGLKLSADKLDQVRALKQKLADLETTFSKNLNEDVTTAEFTATELEGLSADFIARQKKAADGKLIVTTKENDYAEVMANAKRPETRKRMILAYLNRAPANTKIMEDAVVVREQIASLMGYNTWADYRIKGNMADNGANVLSLLDSLKGKLAERNKSDIARLLAAKRKLEDAQAQSIEAWDISYFANQIKKTELNVDDEVIREYFPKDVVVDGLFKVYSQILSVRFEEVKGAPVWAPEVKLYAVKNLDSDDVIAYFYTDFVPREGKYGHAASFPLISGRLFSGGKYSVPVAAIVANLTPPANGKPALLTHDEVETIFHEFGHIMHQTLTRAPYAWLSGSSVAQDFVEAPSQMLENWVWDAQVLNILSGHYTDHSKKLPADLLQKMLAAKDFNQGYYYTRQLVLGLTDMAIHTQKGPVDVDVVYNRIYKDALGVEPVQNAHFMAGFGHLMGGYDAGYYGYIWSEVYAADMFTVFKQGGLLSPTVGAHYRKTILEQGSMIPALDLVKEFLGRDPSPDAFYAKLGIHP